MNSIKQAIKFLSKILISLSKNLILSPFTLLIKLENFVNNWKNYTITQKSEFYLTITLFLLSIIISGTWLWSGLSLKYRKDFRDLNPTFYSTDGKLPEFSKSTKIINDNENQDEKNGYVLLHDGTKVRMPWGVKSLTLHWLMNKNPPNIDFTTLIFMLSFISGLVAGFDGGITSLKNFQLPKGKGTDIPPDQLKNMWSMFICWVIMFFAVLIVRIALTDTDKFTNTILTMPFENICISMGIQLLTIAIGSGFAHVSKDIQFTKNNTENIADIPKETEEIKEEELNKKDKDKINEG